MKKLILAALSIAFFSCSDKDDDTPILMPQTTPLVTKITTDGADGTQMDKVYAITYDANKRIKDIAITGDATKNYHFSYTAAGKVSQIDVTGDSSGVVGFGYDGANRLNLVRLNGGETTVHYDPVSEEYSFLVYNFGFYANGDLSYVNNTDFEYDSSKKGPFANVQSDYQFTGVFFDSVCLYAGCKSALVNWMVDESNATYCANTYSSDGYVTKTVLSGNNNFSLTYEYTNL